MKSIYFYISYSFMKDTFKTYKYMLDSFDDGTLGYVINNEQACFANYGTRYKPCSAMYLAIRMYHEHTGFIDELRHVLSNYTLEVVREFRFNTLKSTSYYYNEWEPNENGTQSIVLFKVDCKNEFTSPLSRYYAILCIGMILRLFNIQDNSTTLGGTLGVKYDNCLKFLEYVNSKKSGHDFFNQKNKTIDAIVGLNNIELIDSFDYGAYNATTTDSNYGSQAKLVIGRYNNYAFLKEVVLCQSQINPVK